MVKNFKNISYNLYKDQDRAKYLITIKDYKLLIEKFKLAAKETILLQKSSSKTGKKMRNITFMIL